QGGYRAVATPLQRSAPTLEPRLSDTGGVRRNAEGASRTVQAGNGSDRCGMWSLRAPTRCIIASQEALAAKGEGSRLKLSVDRRIWAGQPDLIVSQNTPTTAAVSQPSGITPIFRTTGPK